MKTRENILVVDDDPNLRKTLADILRVKGFATAVAAKGAEAIALVEQDKFSLALIDLMLPDMSGLEVMARIKALSPLTEAIILTGHASMDTAIEATSRGAFSYLLKPYQMDELLLTIRHAVERRQAQEEILRLASFPRLLPSPVIEVAPDGDVTYLNPAAKRLFPDLAAKGLSHPLLQGSAEVLSALFEGDTSVETVLEARVGEATYELHIAYVHEVRLILIYVLVITQRKQAEAEIHLLATTDSLTGILNRREFTRIVEQEITRSSRYGLPMALMMYDLDYFKRVNDSFGHDVGDYVLQEVTCVVRQHIRATDVLARWGGEEFMVLMPQTNLQAGWDTSEKLRQALEKHTFDKVNHVAASFGVAEFMPQDDINTLLKRVDDALYLAKEKGRNRVEILPAATAVRA